jgi:CDP-diacylglycerol--glycerol-3-phosphate 3-phosphatidyltransferase
MGKSDRALVFGSIALLIGWGMPVAPYLNLLWLALALLLLLTLCNSGRHVLAARKTSGAD